MGKKVLVASSAGGHWVQMRRLLPAFEGCELVFAGIEPALDPDLAPARYYRVRNVNRRDPLGFFAAAWQVARALGASGRTRWSPPARRRGWWRWRWRS